MAKVGSVNGILVIVYRQISPKGTPQTGTVQCHDVFGLAIYRSYEYGKTFLFAYERIGSITYLLAILIDQEGIRNQFIVLRFGFVGRYAYVD